MAYTQAVLTSLESALLLIREKLVDLHKKIDEDLPDIPTWDELTDNEVFYTSYRNHLVVMSAVMKLHANLTAISVEYKHYRLDELSDGVSISITQKIKKDLNHFQSYIKELQEFVQSLKVLLDYRIKFLSQASYLLTSPYNIQAH